MLVYRTDNEVYQALLGKEPHLIFKTVDKQQFTLSTVVYKSNIYPVFIGSAVTSFVPKERRFNLLELTSMRPFRDFTDELLETNPKYDVMGLCISINKCKQALLDALKEGNVKEESILKYPASKLPAFKLN